MFGPSGGIFAWARMLAGLLSRRTYGRCIANKQEHA
jgi:hypothetical protein